MLWKQTQCFGLPKHINGLKAILIKMFFMELDKPILRYKARVIKNVWYLHMTDKSSSGTEQTTQKQIHVYT